MANLFSLGQLVITVPARDELVAADILDAINRHARGDWGTVDAEDGAANDQALMEGTRLLSAYQDRLGTKFWIISEADRSSTTILLPDDY